MNELDRSSPPPRGALGDFHFPAVTKLPQTNGLDLRVGTLGRLPVVSVNLFMRAGESALGEARAGLAVLTADALEGGSRRRSGSEVAQALESIGARLSSSAGWEGTSVGLSCLAERLPEAMAILAETVLEPAFPQDEVDRAREQQLAAIRQRQMDPGSLASDTARHRYFGDDVPYVRAVDGTEASIEAMGRDSMRGWADAAYRPQGGGLVVVGDVEPTEVEAMVHEHLGDWVGAPPEVPDFVVEPRTRERSITVVHRPTSVQSEIRVGHVGASRSTPDYYPLSIANMVLGGMFTSRLNLNLRERNGFTYGVRSRFAFRSRPGPFQIGAAVGSEVTGAAISEIISELETMASEGPTEDEVTAARDFAAGVFGLQLETAGQIATRITQLVVFGLPDDHFDRYRDNVRSVTRESAAEAAARHIRPAEAQIVVAANADLVVDQLEKLELGPVHVLEAAAP